MKCLETYPFWIVFLSNLVSLATYFLGAFIIYDLGWVWLALYLVYIIYLEFRLISGHCVDCHYHGKVCAFGKGKISGMIFKKGDPKKFCKMKMRWTDILPDFLVSLIPIAVGVIILVKEFDRIILSAVITLFILASAGSAVIRGRLACKYCRQREIGCPAQKLFEKR